MAIMGIMGLGASHNGFRGIFLISTMQAMNLDRARSPMVYNQMAVHTVVPGVAAKTRGGSYWG